VQGVISVYVQHAQDRRLLFGVFFMDETQIIQYCSLVETYRDHGLQPVILYLVSVTGRLYVQESTSGRFRRRRRTVGEKRPGLAVCVYVH